MLFQHECFDLADIMTVDGGALMVWFENSAMISRDQP